MSIRTEPPFRADHVGSLLRPPALLKAREERTAGELTQAELTKVEDDEGAAGDIQWNFEKFLVSPKGEVVHRFRPTVDPKAAEVISALEAELPK